MYNADVFRRTINQTGTFRAEGNSLAGGAITVNITLNTHDLIHHAMDASLIAGRTPRHLEDNMQHGLSQVDNIGE